MISVELLIYSLIGRLHRGSSCNILADMIVLDFSDTKAFVLIVYSLFKSRT